ncbi:MAG: hypothetical protein U0S36_03805 [Candidatus Nanopelagicales bacterium]
MPVLLATRPARDRRGAALAATAAAALLLLTACGSSSSSSTAGTGTGADGFAAYAQCLSDNGVTLPSGGPGGAGGPGGGTPPSGMPTDMPSGAAPGGGPDGQQGQPGDGTQRVPEGVDASSFATAQEACASLRPSGGPGGGGPGGAGVDSSALAAYTSCLSDHDVKVSTPADLRALDTSDTTVSAALATCAPLRPTPSASPSASASS